MEAPAPKRARKESIDAADGASAQRFSELLETGRQLYPIIATLLSEFDDELKTGMRADGTAPNTP